MRRSPCPWCARPLLIPPRKRDPAVRGADIEGLLCMLYRAWQAERDVNATLRTALAACREPTP